MFNSNEKLAQYQHGGDVYGAQRLLGCSLSEIVDYSANINPLVTVEWIKEKLNPYWERVLHYPDPENLELMQAVAELHSVSTEQIVLGNGATPLIHQLVSCIKPDVARVSGPTFGEYQLALDKLGIPVSHAICNPCTLQVSLADLSNIDLHPDQTGLIFLCNPNNPTGQRFEVNEILAMLEALPRSCYLVVDEAFVDFTEAGEANSMAPSLGKFPNLLILRSATKFYGMPGLRLGYLLVGDEALAKAMRQEMPIWQVNVMASGLFLSAYKDFEFREKTVGAIGVERRQLTEALNTMGFTTWDSDANYFIVKPPEGSDIKPLLLRRGILVRSCDNYIGMPKGYFRIAVKNRQNREYLIQSLDELGINHLKGIEKAAEI